MRALKAKRHLIRWARYQYRCEALATRSPSRYGARTGHVVCPGYSKAAWDWANAGRYAPIGIRDIVPVVSILGEWRSR
jgi:hypothetical protein